MQRTRVCLMIEIDLDLTPGTFHTVADAGNQVTRILNDAVPWYHPTVEITAHAPTERF